jgi:hypothetical protein
MAGKPWLVTATMDFLSAKANPLSEEAKHVLLLLEGFARNKPYCWPGNAHLKDLAGKGERALRFLFAELERGEDPWVVRIRSTDGKKKRDGFILRRRANPAMPVAATAEEIVEARKAMGADLREARTGKKLPKSAGNILPQNKAAAQQAALKSSASSPAGAGSADAGKKKTSHRPSAVELAERIGDLSRKQAALGREPGDIYDEMCGVIAQATRGMSDDASERYWEVGVKAIEAGCETKDRVSQ